MAVATWTKADGWAADEVTPYGPFQMDPASAVLHYGQEIFEGLKAYRHADGSIHLFRPEANAERFQSSAARMMLPELPVDDFVTAVEELVKVDERWVPVSAGEQSLYIRPFMFASEVFLGVRAAERRGRALGRRAVRRAPAGHDRPRGPAHRRRAEALRGRRVSR